ncbi:hypothetical protein [Mycobacterium paraterrae]|uniref:Integral membrane protein n=1 Tax=Mycobacterium paraterrae TaxID=577492 RepID=A0ABY3VG30_9MYCO|nr:hypothetical protein [Mycobacterium paraterrae]UMB68382.1 hypothetical protein MKK62_18360 [Mycobacterium paraterrae]
MIRRPPTSVRGAGAIVAAQGATGVAVAAVLLVRAVGGAGHRGNNVFGTSAWFALAGGAVLAAGWALRSGRRWGRGLAVFAELLLLGVAYYLTTGSHRPLIGISVAGLSLVVLALLFSPAALRWVAGADQSEPASSASAEPDTR